MGAVVGLVAIALLVVGNGFFVAAEFAYVAVDRNALETAGVGPEGRSARRAVVVLRRLSFMLSGAQLGITATSLLVGFIAEPVSRRALDPVLGWIGVGESNREVTAVVVGFLLVTVGQMIVAELVPKNLAIARPERVARLTAQPMIIFMRIFGSLISFFDAASNRLLRSVGIEPVEELSDVVSLDELDTIIEESTKEGSLDAGQAGLLENVLAFRLLRAHEIATPQIDVVTVDATASCVDLRDMLAAGRSRFPVLGDDGDVIGVVHGQTLLTVPRSAWATTMLSSLMVAPVFVAEASSLTAVLGALRAADEELAIVLDEYGSFSGIITSEDLAEELVGDIVDESDPEPPRAEHVTERVWVVPGSWRLDEVFEETGIVLPEGRYDTVAGLVLTLLERMANVGDIVRLDNVVVHVREIEGLRITQVALHTARQRREPT